MSPLKTLPVRFFRTEFDVEPVREWLRSLSIDDRRVLGEDLMTVEMDWPLGMPLVEKLEKNLWCGYRSL